MIEAPRVRAGWMPKRQLYDATRYDPCRMRSPWETAAYPNRKARRKIERGMRPNAYY